MQLCKDNIFYFLYLQRYLFNYSAICDEMNYICCYKLLYYELFCDISVICIFSVKSIERFPDI